MPRPTFKPSTTSSTSSSSATSRVIGKSTCCGSSNLFSLIQKKAYELYEKRGRQNGKDFEDWLEAERLVKKEMSK